ncbi:MAG: hypothetical protein R3B36_23520 [Polyangiaceae bacterium]
MPREPSTRHAYEDLLASDAFESIHVGPGASPSGSGLALTWLLESPEGKAALHAVLARGTPAAKLYALVGLYFVDPGAYEDAARDVAASTAEVRTLDGCLGGRTSLREAVFAPSGVRVEVRRGMSLADAEAEAEARARADEADARETASVVCDFAGGCMPLRMLPAYGGGVGTRAPFSR